MEKKNLYIAEFISWEKTVPALLEKSALQKIISQGRRVLLKPNLVNAEPPPVTTPVKLLSAIIDFLKSKCADIEIIIGEGCGDTSFDTWTPFRKLGYADMAAEKNVQLIDLNEAALTKLSRKDCKRWPEIYLPSVILDSFLISVPVLKAHSMADVTLTMKNMLGAAPPKHYNAGSWKKSAFHSKLHEAIFDLNKYRTPDFTILDATIGMSQAHLWGPHCSPPPNLMAASEDPVAIDAFGTEILKKDWRNIPHISLADKILGYAEPLNTIRL